MNSSQLSAPPTFDMVRLGKSKKILDLTADTIREWSKRPGGPRLYKAGKTSWVSATEVAAYIRSQAVATK